MCLNSAGQSSDARIRERVPVKSQAPLKSSSRPPTLLNLDLNQKGHRKEREQTQRCNQLKIVEAEAPSAERLKRQRRTSETRTCITVEPLPPTSVLTVHLLKERLETQQVGMSP